MLFIDGEKRDLIRGISITAAAIVLALSAAVFYRLSGAGRRPRQDTQAALMSGEQRACRHVPCSSKDWHLKNNAQWLPRLGITYHLGVDGLNAPMVLLTGMVTVAGVLISWRIDDRTREFMAFFMLLVAGVYGVFLAIDMFVLFFFYELAIFPMYLLIATWGWVKLREYAAMKLTLYILIGSVIALVGVIAMVFTASNFFAR